MKKFLSLLLALTLVLSLVVVPARAEGVEVGGTYAITTSASSLARGDSTTFTVTATAPTLKEALCAAYEKAEKISFENAFYRKDIGLKALNAGKEN